MLSFSVNNKTEELINYEERLDELVKVYNSLTDKVMLNNLYNFKGGFLRDRFEFMRYEFIQLKLDTYFNADGTMKSNRELTLEDVLNFQRYSGYMDCMEHILYFIENQQSLLTMLEDKEETRLTAREKAIREDFLVEGRFDLEAELHAWNLGNPLLNKLKDFIYNEAYMELVNIIFPKGLK